MSKSNNQSNSLDNIKFVQDIIPEAAANYSGGEGRINDFGNDPDIILYENADRTGQSLGINAATGDGISSFPAPFYDDFNDKTSSVEVIRGSWDFFTDANYGGLAYGNEQNFVPNDAISSLKRVG